jgi:hypothetical protein
MPDEKLRYQTCIGGYVLKRIIGHSEDDESFPTYVSSSPGGYKPKGVIKESGIAAHASVRGQNMLAGVPDVVLTNDCLMQ